MSKFTKTNSSYFKDASQLAARSFTKRKEKIILCGDYNLLPDTQSLAILENGLNNLVKRNDINSTRSILHTGTAKITDYILVSPNVIVKEFKTIPILVSDHLPLYIEFE